MARPGEERHPDLMREPAQGPPKSPETRADEA